MPQHAGKEQMPSGSSSLVNKVEAEMLLCVFQQFMRKLPELTQRPATAIITPYKAQASNRVVGEQMLSCGLIGIDRVCFLIGMSPGKRSTGAG